MATVGFQKHVLFPDNPVLFCSADDECTLSKANVKVKCRL